jgi:hypothetical protein
MRARVLAVVVAFIAITAAAGAAVTEFTLSRDAGPSNARIGHLVLHVSRAQHTRRARKHGRSHNNAHNSHAVKGRTGSSGSSSLVAAYAFDEGSGTFAADGSGNGHAGALVNASFVSSGKYLGAVSFPGSNSYVTIGNAADLNPTSGFTLEAWVKPATIRSGYATLVAKTTGAGQFPYGLELTNGIPSAYGEIGSTLASASATTALPTGKWSYVAGSYNGSSLSVYVNSKLIANVPASGTVAGSIGALEIGGDNVGKGDLDGAVDNVRVYNDARTAAQVSSDGTTPIATLKHTSPKKLSLAIPPVSQGLPAISGSTIMGSGLTATNGSWSNSPTSYSYQWRDCDSSGGGCSNIPNATDGTYKLTGGDVGHTVDVVVGAANAGGSANASSTPTAVVGDPPPPVNTSLPLIGGTALSGDTLSATTGAWSNTPTSYGYQWKDCDLTGSNCTPISGATASSYTLQSSDLGSTVVVVVTGASQWGSTAAQSLPTIPIALPPLPPINISAPTISGSAEQGDTLTAGTGSWIDNPTAYAYQWENCNLLGLLCAPISGATSSSYTLGAGDVGHTIEVVVTASNSGGAIAASSAPTGTVSPPPPPPPPVNTSVPAISGTAQQDDTLTASAGSWSNSPTGYAYQWQDCNSSGASCSNIAGATGSSYVLAASDVGQTVEVTVTASNAGGSTPASSGPTGVVLITAPVNTSAPAISGTAQQGDTLTASTGSWSNSPTGYTYQWQDCNSSGASCSNIAGATGTGYIVAATDIGHTIEVVVTASNAGGPTSASSSSTGTVTAAPPANTAAPAISGTAQQGDTLTTSSGSWSNSPTSFAYQWLDCNSSGAGCSAISGATSSSYKLGAGDVGDTVEVVVTATNTGGSTPATSGPTGVVLIAAPVNTSAPAISGTAQQGDTLSTTNGGWSNSPASFAYQWEDCNSSGGSCSAIAGATSNSYVLSAGDVGHSIRVVVTATNGGGSTGASSGATASVAAPPPPAPVNTAAPSISGTAQQGDTLTASSGSWSNSPTSYSYQWQDCNSSGGGCTNISGVTSSSYAPGAGDVGDTIEVTVTAANAGGSASATSGATAVVASGSSGPTIKYYVGQSSAGSGNGSSCANAEAVSTLSTSTQWTAGNVIGLCGTITSTITAQGSGTNGNPITVYWEPGATLSQAVCPSSGCFNTNSHTYLTLDGGSNGSIQATANGTVLAHQTGSTEGIEAYGCTGCVIENLTVENLYVHVYNSSTEPNDTNGGGANAIDIYGSGWTLTNNTISNANTGIYDEAQPSDASDTISANTFTSDAGDWLLAPVQGSGTNIGPIYFDGNTLDQWTNWRTSSDTFHPDGVHCYVQSNLGPAHFNAVYIYDNTMGPNTANINGGTENQTAEVFLQGNGGGPGGTECADTTSPFYVFNNVFQTNQYLNNGLLAPGSGEPFLLNNTIIGATSGSGGGVGYSVGANVDGNGESDNNLVTNVQQATEVNPTGSIGIASVLQGGWNYNVYSSVGASDFNCNGAFDSFAGWQSCVHGDAHSSYNSGADLNGDGSPQAGSPAIGAGENLSSLCTGALTALCDEINGTPRPSSGAWNAGAY